MNKIKWIFFGYLAFVAAMVVAIGTSIVITPPRDPQTLYTPYLASLKTLDPAVCNDLVGSVILGNVYETLYNYKYGVMPYELFPQLAAADPEVSPDGLTITVKLRKGIRFYDPYREAFKDGLGPEMTAADVIYSWKRVADFKVASPNYSTVFQEKVVGLDEWYEYTHKQAEANQPIDYDRPVEGLRALDDYTLRITLTKPAPQFRYLMAFSGASIVCRKAVEFYGDRFSNRPVGTGPYVLRSHLPEQRILFERSPAWRGRPDVDGYANLPPDQQTARIPRIQYDYFRELVPLWYLFQRGYYDVSTIPKESFDQAIDPKTQELTAEMKKRGVVLTKDVEPTTYFYGFNMTDPVVGKNKPLRQAMSLAYDRATYLRIYRNGRGKPANGPIPPGLPTYDPGANDLYSHTDLRRARELMKEAVAVNGGPIPPLRVLMQDTDTDSRQQAEYFIKQMAQLDLTIHPEYNTYARYQELVDNRQTQVFAGGWIADYPDEQTFLQLFYGKFAPPGGVNPTAYNNPAFDALYEKAMVMEPSPQRNELYRQMLAIANEDCPWICDFYNVVYTLQYDWLSTPKAMDYGTGYRQFLTLDSAKRQRWMAAKK